MKLVYSLLFVFFTTLLSANNHYDFDLIKIIFEELYPKNPTFQTLEIINFLNNHPNLVNINKDIKQKRLSSWKKFNH